jgi:NADPH2:quinone reductase
LGFTRFGAYARHAVTDHRAVVPVAETMDNGTAAALGTQYVTAIHAGYDIANMQKGEHVLIHAAAGGVGTALIQLAKHRGCVVYGTASSDSKIEFMKSNGANFGINYIENDFSEEIRRIRNGKGIDVVIDPIGGKNFKKSMQLLEPGGRIVGYGASDQLNHKGSGIISKLKLLFGFGFLHPIGIIVNSRGILGVNLLKIADNKPEVIERCMHEVMRLTQEGVLKPVVGAEYNAKDLAEAHAFIESRKSTGKLVLNW